MSAALVTFGARPLAPFVHAAAAVRPVDVDDRVLVLVELAGGNDGLNTVAPYTHEVYRKLRPSLALSPGAVLKLNDTLGLHPAMKGFKELFDAGALAIVQGVGYPAPNRSHFRSMDIWHSARPDLQQTNDGWLGRVFDQRATELAGTVPGMALGTDRLPLALVARRMALPTVRDLKSFELSLGGDDPSNRELRRKLMRELASPQESGDSELAFLRRTTSAALDTAAKLQEAAKAYTPAKPYPKSGLGQRLQTVAQLIRARLGARVFFVSLDGFDTHAEQGGAHTALLGELAAALSAFHTDLKGQKLADQVLVATFSEFGRRVKENGSLGTDHGAGAPMFLVGSRVKPGIHGAHPSLTDLDEGDLKHHTDFRAVYATLLEHWLGWPSGPALGSPFTPLPIIEKN